MATNLHAIDPNQMARAAVDVAGRKADWIILGQALSRWLLWATVLVSVLMGMENDLGAGRLISGVVMGILGFAFVSLGDGIVSLLWLLLRWLLPRIHLSAAAAYLAAVPAAMVGRILGVLLYIGGDLLLPGSVLQHVMVAPVGELFIILMGVTGVLVTLARSKGRRSDGQMYLVAAAVLNVVYFFWVLQPGTDAYLAQAPEPAAAAAPTLALPNPGMSGPYGVQTLTYGSGKDLHRAEFGDEATLVTQSVDGSQIFGGYGGLGGSYFRWYWGFDFTELPLNGLVWYPQGDDPSQGAGPFPIVLIVHGNHVMTAPSDRGYAYLGEHLASQGYIAVSVDENYLNGVMFLDGEMAEMPLRAWILLKHLQVWQSWNETEGNPFFGQVDMQRVALIGHSRGGEAVAVAAEMNWRTAPPVLAVDDGSDFGFGIESVVAIAPSDGNYKPDNQGLTLNHSDYLLLGGGHDADTYTLYGQAQYNRTRFEENTDGFKALAYIYRANHGQFNTVWADRDRGWLNSLLLNRKPLLSAEEQEEAAKVVISAFLHASLQGESSYRALFANGGAGNAWLPGILMVTQYEAADFVALNAEPSDVLEPAVGRRQALKLRDGTTSQQNWALHVTWEAGTGAVLDVPADATAAVKGDWALTFALASAEEISRPVDVRLELTLDDGRTMHLSLRDFAPLYPPLPARLVKADWLAPLPGYKIAMQSPFERVLQTYTAPLTAFEGVASPVDIEDVQSVRIAMDGVEGGALYVDALGFTAVP